MSALVVREADFSDLEAIVRLYETDPLSSRPDRWAPETQAAYSAAFARITTSEDHALFVAERGGAVVGTLQATYVPCLKGTACARIRLEAVVVDERARSGGIGAAMVAAAEDWGRARGARFVELSSGERRVDAHRFYERLGYGRTQFGFKKELS